MFYAAERQRKADRKSRWEGLLLSLLWGEKRSWRSFASEQRRLLETTVSKVSNIITGSSTHKVRFAVKKNRRFQQFPAKVTTLMIEFSSNSLSFRHNVQLTGSTEFLK